MISKPLIEEIISLANNELLIAIFSKAFRGFNREELDIPINNLYLSFMPEETKISYFEDDTATTCRKTEFTLKMTVYAPATRRGEQVQAIAEVVADFLSDKYMGEMTGYTIGDLSYDDGVNALTLPTHFRFVYYECPLEGVDDAPADTVPDTFFCKSHINNGDIHLSEEDRLLLTEPFVVGSYTGNGAEAGQDIVLGFRPKLVIVYRNSYHASLYSSSDGISKCYMSVAAGTSYMRGLLITDDGFKARTVATSNATTYLNDSSGSYTYIAFR